MADFSKQYCELHDPEMPHDFDILEIAEGLENEYSTAIICEGFGFLAIGKDKDGNIILAVPTGEPTTDEGVPVIWKAYSEVVTLKN
jgi:hypothetical protein